MCLSSRWHDVDTVRWLERRPDTIVAYKLVEKKKRRYQSFHFCNVFYSKKVNKIKVEKDMISTSNTYEKYQPYYHLFLFKKGARELKKRWGEYSGNACIIKCEIPKDAITTIGEQNMEFVIVAKEFKIIKEIE